MQIKIIVPLSLLKDGMTCYKITGEKPYIISRKITIGDKIISCDNDDNDIYDVNLKGKK
jgi:hypothetical protein